MHNYVKSEGKIEIKLPMYASSVKELDDKIDALLCKNAMVVDEIRNVQTKIEALQPSVTRKIDDVENKIEKHQTQWSDLFKSMENKEVITVDQVKKAINEVTELDKEMELRSRGIVIYNAPEENETETHKSNDAELVTGLLKQIRCEETKVIGINRLGRFSQDKISSKKFRPIKVRFDSNQSRDLVLKSLFRLKDASAPFSRLSIRQDLSLSQRQELNDKLKEAYELTSNSDFIHRVKGSPGNYTVKQIKKKPA